MAELDRQLGAGGFLVKEGTMIDATLIEAQAARSRDDRVNEAPPQDEPAEPRVDPDAAFTKKEGKTVYGYKAHVAVDRGSGLIRRARLTPANVHDTREADALVMGDERAIYADMAYATHARRAALKERGIKDLVMQRPNKHHPQLPHWQLPPQCFSSVPPAPLSSARSARSNAAMATGRCATFRSSPMLSSCSSNALPSTCAASPFLPPTKPKAQVLIANAHQLSFAPPTPTGKEEVRKAQPLDLCTTNAADLYSAEVSRRV